MNGGRGSKQILIHGMSLVLVGMIWGLVVPHTAYPTLALTAHTQFEGNGILFIVVAGLLLKLPHAAGRMTVGTMLLAVWLVWIMMISEVANSWWGTTEILPIAAHQAGATGGTPGQELFVKLAHIVAGLALIIAWILLMIAFIRPAPAVPDQRESER
jgi:(hydroxyamino)benzene mutase